MIKGIIFDLDGTIIDTREDLALAINLMRADYKLPRFTVEKIASYVGNGARKLVERSLFGTGINIDEALEIYKNHYSQHLTDNTYCYDGAIETVMLYQTNTSFLLVGIHYQRLQVPVQGMSSLETVEP